ncbi:hypothetical protein, partial [Caballeronia sordidicola]|uniref:hypothetical protein n=1 Tax=Caballeronia sordidicola TaxID=196367 RepID=UPI001C502090
SCLCGSKRADRSALGVSSFLSCLCGSKPHVFCAAWCLVFLSCLCGSKLDEPCLNALISKNIPTGPAIYPNRRLIANSLIYQQPKTSPEKRG